MASPERTQKGPSEFKNQKEFIEYCKKVAAWLYKLFTGKDLSHE